MTIADIKSSLSIIDVLAIYGFKPDQNGKMCCPFHDDKKPSMQVYTKKNTVYCFSSNCTLSGKPIDGIDVIMYKEGITKHQALLKATELAQKYSTSNPSPNHKIMTTNPIAQPDQDLDKLFRTLRQKYYRGSLAQDYAKARYLDHKKVELGFNPYSFKEFKKLQNCLIFPLKDIDDKVVSFYGRSISKNPQSKHFYMSGRTGLYPGYPDIDTRTLIICEAPVDAATLISHIPKRQAGLPKLTTVGQQSPQISILSLFGANVWNEEHTQAVKRLTKLEEVIFFMDGDTAGEQAVQTYSRLVKALTSECIVSRVDMPESEDINSLLDSHSPEILQHLIDKRILVNGSDSKRLPFLFSSELSSESRSRSLDTHKNEEVDKKDKVVDSLNNDNGVSDSKGEELNTDEQQEPQQSTSLPPLNLDNPEYISWERHLIEFTVMGGIKLYPIDQMNVMLGMKKKGSHKPLQNIRQRVNLYHDDMVEKLARKVASRMELGTNKVHEAIIELTDLLEQNRQEQIKAGLAVDDDKKEMSVERRKSVQAFLDQKGLDKKTNKLIGETGLVGEEINRMILWYIYGYRKSDKPLHVMCLGASGTGKTYLQEKVGGLIPEEEKKEITAMSDNAVYYFEEDELVHKLLMIEDLDGANEQKILYALRELMSKTSVTKDVVIKDNKGKLRTISLRVNGPVCITGTTTRESLYADNADRTIMIYLDGSPEQVQRVLDYMRKVNAGKIDKYRQTEIIEFLQDVQRVLKPITVIIPYAEDLVLPTWFLKQYRTNSHYQEFIKAVTFYHQRQREVKTDSHGNKYIESTYEDIEIANRLIKDVLLAKSDELTKASRNFFEMTQKYLDESGKESFRARDIRLRYRMSPTAIGRYMKKLTAYGYFKIVSGSKKKGFEYEIENNIEDRRGKLGSVLDEILAQIKKKYDQ